ncbi:hypothetical protein BDW67DRAFT_145344 [Aspergillus spinulosporus]
MPYSRTEILLGALKYFLFFSFLFLPSFFRPELQLFRYPTYAEMSFANILLLAALPVATIASAQTHRLFPGMHVEAIGELVPRRLYDNASECTIRDTCGECFGFGYVLCDRSGCFNPDDGEQCCKDGYTCVGRDDSCCPNGPGEPGEDGTVTYPSDTSIEEDEDEDDESTSWTCDTTMTGEECCSGGGPDIHWCTGEYPMVTCYNSTRQTCCEDGHFCEGEDCCDIVVCAAPCH